MKNRSSSSQNVIKDKCGRFILNITTLYETSLNLTQIHPNFMGSEVYLLAKTFY
jgi:hypothetical protein